MNDFAALSRLIENLIRYGTIAEVDEARALCRVKSGSIVTAWRPWISARAGEDREWNPPTIGEQVIYFSPSGLLAQGVALCGLPSDVFPANGDRAALHRTTYRDGAVVEYDSEAHFLRAILPAGGKTELVSTGGILIEGNVTLIGDLTQTGKQTVSGDVVAGGISQISHTHPGIQRGGASTDKPQ
ncbi:phage baseplate assembly protein V [Pseudomonas nitroreducens]|uniref:phage baseplate assembly protein V n=1 Tax=Pseudomonas nitroreducens TaxID=46680 RepID=UPI002657F6FD|nr:phage baseplate assembly protein V [Pseudomonas nitroreducens]MCP1651799.1 phage baseplate assembly protein V [Pseudomonas nitroreducens]MCP1689573.1 phage baseplate assembly protein V [Pseudomonas nitroreducens]